MNEVPTHKRGALWTLVCVVIKKGLRCPVAVPSVGNWKALPLLYHDKVHQNNIVTLQQLMISDHLCHSVFFHLSFRSLYICILPYSPTGKSALVWLKSCKNQHCGLSTVCNHVFLKGFSGNTSTFITYTFMRNMLFLILIFHANSRQMQLYLHIIVIVADGALFS